MPIDPKSIVSVIGLVSGPVRLSDLDDLYVQQQQQRGERPAPEDVTRGLASAIRQGWIHTDGLRVFVSHSGRELLNAGYSSRR